MLVALMCIRTANFHRVNTRNIQDPKLLYGPSLCHIYEFLMACVCLLIFYTTTVTFSRDGTLMHCPGEQPF